MPRRNKNAGAINHVELDLDSLAAGLKIDRKKRRLLAPSVVNGERYQGPYILPRRTSLYLNLRARKMRARPTVRA